MDGRVLGANVKQQGDDATLRLCGQGNGCSSWMGGRVLGVWPQVDNAGVGGGV